MTQHTDVRVADEPAVVSAEDLVPFRASPTHGIDRQQAFAAEDRWFGRIRMMPDGWSGWHHHAETDTYLFVVSGELEFEYGTEGKIASVAAGEFGYIPHRVVHRERAVPGVGCDVVLVRIGRGPTVVNVDGPTAG